MSIVMLNQFGDPLQCHTLAFSDSSRSFRWFVWRRTIERPVLLHTLRWHPTLAPYAGTYSTPHRKRIGTFLEAKKEFAMLLKNDFKKRRIEQMGRTTAVRSHHSSPFQAPAVHGA